MTIQKTLRETLAEIKASREAPHNSKSPPTPNWLELGLDKHISRLGISLAVYFATFVLFWCHVIGVITFPLSTVLTFIVIAPANYLFLVWTAYTIQRVLHESGLQKHGAWQVWVGALLLNPVILGWYIPVSVLFSARRIRRQIEDQHAAQ